MANVSWPDQKEFAAVVAFHVGRYPLLELQDLYKLSHQACLGSGHAVPDPAMALQWLANELRELGEGPAEPALDPISLDGGILRVHLRPYLAGGGDIGQLAYAFVRTANEYKGSLAKLDACWTCVEEMTAAGSLPFPEADARYIRSQVEAQNFPAVHHSDAFRAAYRPAYRVVATAFLSRESDAGGT